MANLDNDEFNLHSTRLSDPAEHASAVTPNDGTDLANVCRAFYVGGAGDVAVVTRGDETVTLAGVQSGMVIPLRVKRILATGTTATSIVAFW